MLVVDAALQQQLQSWQRKPPVPSASFKAIGKQLAKLLEAIQVVETILGVGKAYLEVAVTVQFWLSYTVKLT